MCSVQLNPARRAVEGYPEQEVARYSGPDETAPNMGDMNKLIEEGDHDDTRSKDKSAATPHRRSTLTVRV